MHDISHEYAPDSKSLLRGDSSLSSIASVRQHNRYTTDGESFPNRIPFIGVQHRRRIVHLDDGVSSRVDEGKALSQSIRFVWPHDGPYMWVKQSGALSSGLEVERTRLRSGYHNSRRNPIYQRKSTPKNPPRLGKRQPVQRGAGVLERRGR